jgi:hypothetical protein
MLLLSSMQREGTRWVLQTSKSSSTGRDVASKVVATNAILMGQNDEAKSFVANRSCRQQCDRTYADESVLTTASAPRQLPNPVGYAMGWASQKTGPNQQPQPKFAAALAFCRQSLRN